MGIYYYFILFGLIVFGLGCSKSTPHYVVSESPFYVADSKQPSLNKSSDSLVSVNPAFLPEEPIGVSGITEGFGRLTRDKMIDFAMVMPAIAPGEALDLGISDILSNQYDTMRLPLGKSLDVPSNVTFPYQKERYSFITVTFDKPEYRFYPKEPGIYKLTATHGRFPLTKMIDDRDKPLFELINNFDIIQGGDLNVIVDRPNTVVNLPVNQTQYSNTFTTVAPELPADMGLVKIAFYEKEGLLVPTDLKQLESGERRTLKTVPFEARKMTLSLFRKNDLYLADFGDVIYIDRFRSITNTTESFDQLSLTLVDGTEPIAPTYLPLIQKPHFTDSGIFVDPPKNVDSVLPLYTQLELVQTGPKQANVPLTQVIWAEHIGGWTNHFELPNLKLPEDYNYQWRVSFYGIQSKHPMQWDQDSDTIPTHVTRNAVNF